MNDMSVKTGGGVSSASLAPVLDIAGLTVAFRASAGNYVPVVRDISLQIAPRETLAVVGESGSGKSVTAMAALRLLPPAQSRVSGHIRIEGQDVAAMSERQLLDLRGGTVGMIFQEPMTSLNPVYTVGQQIAEALERHRGLKGKAALDEARRLLDLMRIPDAARRVTQFPHEMSGGMRQRVMIAMAIAGRPKLLIADEPTTALDVTVQARILGLLRELQVEMDMALMFITHDMGVVAQMADRMLVMNRGDAVETGEVREVFAHPREAYTRMLLDTIPVLGSAQGKPGPQAFSSAARAATAVRLPDAGALPVLKVEGLTVRFAVRSGWLQRHHADVHAVENVSFQIAPGETLALVGESGSGKSTTGRAVLQLEKPTSGRVEVQGKEITALDQTALRALRPKMQMIFQDPYGSLNPRRSVGEAITDALRWHGLAEGEAARERLSELLVQVGLDPSVAGRLPHEFSGGQRQRISIARALALQPELLVADEAVSALDVSIKAQIIDLMIELQSRTGVACLFISHDMAIVERISHRIAVMLRGEIVEIGPRDALIHNPAHPYTKRLLASVPVPDPARRSALEASPIEDLVSPLRPLGETRVHLPMREVGPGHFVRAQSA